MHIYIPLNEVKVVNTTTMTYYHHHYYPHYPPSYSSVTAIHSTRRSASLYAALSVACPCARTSPAPQTRTRRPPAAVTPPRR